MPIKLMVDYGQNRAGREVLATYMLNANSAELYKAAAFAHPYITVHYNGEVRWIIGTYTFGREPGAEETVLAKSYKFERAAGSGRITLSADDP